MDVSSFFIQIIFNNLSGSSNNQNSAYVNNLYAQSFDNERKAFDNERKAFDYECTATNPK